MVIISYKGNRRMNLVQERKRGIVLVTTMLTVVLVIMLVSTVVFSNLSNMQMTSTFYDKEAALMAANSGVQYALTRLQSDASWNGCGGSSSKAAGGTFQVEEKNGNVTGIITAADGRRSVFRIKFNYEDGDGGLDGLSNTEPQSKRIASQFVSVNNLTGSVPVKVYTAGTDGRLETKTDSDGRISVKSSDSQSAPHTVPRFTCDLIVEGFSGRGTREATLDAPIDERYGSCRETVEVYASMDASEGMTDSVACAAGSVKGQSYSFLVSTKEEGGNTNIRSLNGIELNMIQDGKKQNKFSLGGGTVYYGENFKSNVKNIETGVKSAQSKNGDNFTRLEWEKIPKASASGNSIKAGSYIWMKPEGSSKPVLMYFSKSYPGKELPKSGGVPVSSGNGMTVDADTMTIMFDQDTYVKGDATKDLVIRSGINEYGTKPIIGFVKNKASDSKSTILTCTGNVTIKGVSIGSGAITAEGNINMQGPSVLESDPGLGISYYSKGDINIEKISNTTKYAEENHPVQRDAGTGPIDMENLAEAEETETQTGASVTPEDSKSGAEKLKDIEYVAKLSVEYMNDDFHGAISHEGSCKYCGGGKRQYCASDAKGFTTTGLTAVQKAYMAGLQGSSKPQVCTRGECGYCLGTPRERLSRDHKKDCPLTAAIDEAWKSGGKERSEILNEKTEPAEDEQLEDMPVELNADKAVSNYVQPGIKTENYEDYKKNQLETLISRYGSLRYSDQDISGVMYAWGNININIGRKSNLHLTGSMIAYGQDPQNGAPQSSGNTGNINYNAGTMDLNFDPNYITNLAGAAVRRKLKITLYGIY